MKKKLLVLLVLALILTGCGKEKKYIDVCEEGFELVDGKCRYEAEQVEPTIEYSCEEGLELKDKYCIRTVTTEKTEVKKCAKGYTLRGEKCYKTVSKKANVKYSCTSGTVKGSKCVQKVADTDALIYGYVCPSGTKRTNLSCYYTKLPSEKCKSGFKEEAGGYSCTKYATKDYYCARGTQVSKTICMVEVSTKAKATYSCGSGYTLSGTKCKKEVSVSPTTVKSCPSNYKESNGKCVGQETLGAITKFNCEEGYVSIEDNCIKWGYVEPTKKEVE